MKRIFSTILAVMLLMGLMAVPAFASGLTIVSSSVFDGDEAAPVSALITFKFSESIADVAANNTITLTKDGSSTNLVKSFSSTDDVLKIYLKAELEYNTNYTLNLGAISSTNALNSLSDSEITFKTRYGTNNVNIVEEDFETGKNYTFRVDQDKDGTDAVQKTGDNGNYSLKLDKSFDLIPDGKYGVTNTTLFEGKSVVEFDINPVSIANGDRYAFFTLLSRSHTDNEAEGYKACESKRLLVYDSKSNKLGVIYNEYGASTTRYTLYAGETLQAGWNNVKVLVDNETQTIRLYVNNKLVKDDEGVCDFKYAIGKNTTIASSGTSLYNVRFHSLEDYAYTGGVNSEVYFDNFSFRSASVQSPVDNQLCQLTASNPDVNKVVHLGEKEFEFTFNHNINVHSLENVTINGTAVKSFAADGNKITVTLADNYELEINNTYLVDFCLAEDVYGSAVPSVTFATKANYNMYSPDFENGFDTNLWEIAINTSAHDSTINVIDEPGNTDNSVLHFNRTLGKYDETQGGYTAPDKEDIRFKRKDAAPWLDINGNAMLGFSMKINSLNWNGRKDYNFISLYDYTLAPTDSNPNKYTSSALDWIFQLEKTDDANTFKVRCSEYLSKNNEGAPVRSSKDSGVTVTLDSWINLFYEFDFERMEYYAYIKNTKTGPYSFKEKQFKGIDSVVFYGSSMAMNMYLDDISLGQKFYADTDYDFGFFNAEGEEIDTVDTEKTIYRATIVNRGKSADNTKLILTVTDETEKRLSEVRLINFADLEESKNGENEIIIEEEFPNLGAGKKIKAFYWQDFASLRPSAASTRLLPLVAEAASAN